MPTIVSVRQNRTTREWRWECQACSGYPRTGGTAPGQPEALTAALAHIAGRGHQMCRCGEPGVDPYRCEADDCRAHDWLALGGSPEAVMQAPWLCLDLTWSEVSMLREEPTGPLQLLANRAPV